MEEIIKREMITKESQREIERKREFGVREIGQEIKKRTRQERERRS